MEQAAHTCSDVLSSVHAGCAANKPAEAWLPDACWGGLPPSLQSPPCSTSAPGTAKFGPSSILLPQGKSVGSSGATTIEYTSLAQLQVLSRWVLCDPPTFLVLRICSGTGGVIRQCALNDCAALKQDGQVGSSLEADIAAAVSWAHGYI